MTNTLPLQQDFHHQGIIIDPDQKPEPNYILESCEEDTGLHQSTTDTAQYNPQEDDLSTIPEEEEELDPADQDTLVFESESEQSDDEHFDTAVDTMSNNSAVTMGKPVTAAFISNLAKYQQNR